MVNCALKILLPAVLAVGLREHHELDVGRVAAQTVEGLDQVLDLVVGQRQAPGDIGRSSAARPPPLDNRHAPSAPAAAR